MKAVGDRYEQFAADYLMKRGLIIVGRNFHTRLGEIDIIAKRKEKYYFFEVRYRGKGTLQTSGESITTLKKSRIFSSISVWLMKNGIEEECLGGVFAFLIDGGVGEGGFVASNGEKNVVKIIEIGV